MSAMSFIRIDITIIEVDNRASKELADMHARCFTHAWSQASFKAFLEKPNHRAMVAGAAVAGHDPVGFVLIRSVADKAEILSISVVPEHRNAGVASGLLYQICELLKREGVKKIFLEVGRQNRPALRLYEKLDFRSVGNRKAYYRTAAEEPPRDALIMEKIL